MNKRFIRMPLSKKDFYLFSVFYAFVFLSTACSQPDNYSIDRFCIDQVNNIMRPENFGIANGKITTGIKCTDLFSIDGIWAPPYVSSDFSFQGSVNGQSVQQPQYLSWPFYIERSAVLEQALLAKTNTLLIPEGRTFIFSLLLKNQGKENTTLSLEFSIKGTLDKMVSDSSWGFAAPHSTTAARVKELILRSLTDPTAHKPLGCAGV